PASPTTTTEVETDHPLCSCQRARGPAPGTSLLFPPCPRLLVQHSGSQHDSRRPGRPGREETLAGADGIHQRCPRGRPAGSGRPRTTGPPPRRGPVPDCNPRPPITDQSPTKTPRRGPGVASSRKNPGGAQASPSSVSAPAAET